MANRFRNQNYGRRGGSNRSSEYYGNNYGGFSSDYDREENYERPRYGRRNMGRNYGSDNRDYEDDYTNDFYQSRRGYLGYSGDYPESERGFDLEHDEERSWLDRASDEVSSWFGDEEAERRRQLDERRRGHRGRGPRSYKRSDDRIREDINDRLTEDYYLDASDIEVEISNGEVVLTGTVDSRSAKRLAEDIAESVSGVTNVENRIRVKQSFSEQGGSSFTRTTGNTGTTAGTNPSIGMPDRVSGSTGITSTGASETNDTPLAGESRSKTA